MGVFPAYTEEKERWLPGGRCPSAHTLCIWWGILSKYPLFAVSDLLFILTVLSLVLMLFLLTSPPTIPRTIPGIGGNPWSLGTKVTKNLRSLWKSKCMQVFLGPCRRGLKRHYLKTCGKSTFTKPWVTITLLPGCWLLCRFFTTQNFHQGFLQNLLSLKLVLETCK